MYLRSTCLALFALAVLPVASPAMAQNLNLEFAQRTNYHIFYDDFDNFEADQWLNTVTEAGAGDSTEVISDADGGVLLLTMAGNDADNNFFQWSGDDASTAKETFTFTAGYPLYFETRIRLSEVTQFAVAIGLQNIDTTPLAVTDGIWLGTDDGDALLDAHVAIASTQTNATGVATLVAATWTTLAFYYPGSGNIDIYVDGTSVGSMASTNAPSTELAVSFAGQNGEATADTLEIDYIFVAKCRDAAVCGVGL